MSTKRKATKLPTAIENLNVVRDRISPYVHDSNLSDNERLNFFYAVQQIDYALEILQGEK